MTNVNDIALVLTRDEASLLVGVLGRAINRNYDEALDDSMCSIQDRLADKLAERVI